MEEACNEIEFDVSNYMSMCNARVNARACVPMLALYRLFHGSVLGFALGFIASPGLLLCRAWALYCVLRSSLAWRLNVAPKQWCLQQRQRCICVGGWSWRVVALVVVGATSMVLAVPLPDMLPGGV